MPDALAQQMRRVEELVEALEKIEGPVAASAAREMVHTLLALHHAGLARMLEIAQQAEGGPEVRAAWGCDDLVSGLLLLHGLHPVALETRVRQALEQVRPLVRCHGSDLELVVVGETVRVRLVGPCSLSPATLQMSLEDAFTTLAPEVLVVEVEDGSAPRPFPLPLVPSSPPSPG